MKFSIVVPHYDKSIPDEILQRGLDSLANQSFRDFEVLLFHDGPVSRRLDPKVDRLPSISIEVTSKRENNWGHGNRDRGIRKAKGEYIIHFNPDNILYPNALEEILLEINKNYDKVETTNKIIIFPILMMGMQSSGKYVWRDVENASSNYMIFTGFPTIKYNIDAMQLVMSKDLWLKYNGWYDKSKESDGNMYPRFVNDNGARYCSKILGEHW